jgi:hypothetical protein
MKRGSYSFDNASGIAGSSGCRRNVGIAAYVIVSGQLVPSSIDAAGTPAAANLRAGLAFNNHGSGVFNSG